LEFSYGEDNDSIDPAPLDHLWAFVDSTLHEFGETVLGVGEFPVLKAIIAILARLARF
jgi:hypothetical protein